MPDARTATLTRMALPGHECPFGVRARAMLEAAGYAIDEHNLRTRDEVDEYKERESVETTPQIDIGGTRIGGAGELQLFLSQQPATT